MAKLDEQSTTQKMLQILGAGAATAKYVVLDPKDVAVGERDDRETSHKENWTSLLEGIKARAVESGLKYGNHTAILVVGKSAPYELVQGARRLQASKELGLMVNAQVFPGLTKEERYLLMITENTHRNNLTPFEAARQAVKMRDEMQFDSEKIAWVLGKGASTIRAYFQIHGDPKAWAVFRKGKLTLRAARELVGRSDKTIRDIADALDLSEEETGTDAPAGTKGKGKSKGGNEEAEAPKVAKAVQHSDSKTWDKDMLFRFKGGPGRKADVLKAHRLLSDMRALVKQWARDGGYGEEAK